MSHEQPNPVPCSETPPSATETLAEYCARISAETLAECAAREHARKLRFISYARACRSPAQIHCATSEAEYRPEPRACQCKTCVEYTAKTGRRALDADDIVAEKAIQSAIQSARVAAYSGS